MTHQKPAGPVLVTSFSTREQARFRVACLLALARLDERIDPGPPPPTRVSSEIFHAEEMVQIPVPAPTRTDPGRTATRLLNVAGGSGAVHEFEVFFGPDGAGFANGVQVAPPVARGYSEVRLLELVRREIDELRQVAGDVEPVRSVLATAQLALSPPQLQVQVQVQNGADGRVRSSLGDLCRDSEQAVHRVRGTDK